MYTQYIIPIQLFLILEKITITCWTAKNLKPNHSMLLIDNKWFFCINQIFRNELFFSNSILIENTVIDAKNLNKSSTNLNTFFKQNRLTVYYSYFFF